jgi:proteasome lid subunit RPN8/RPN11
MLRLSRHHLDTIHRAAESSYPYEACGVLLGNLREGIRETQDVVPCGNAAGSRTAHYQIAPEELVAAQKEGRERGLDIIGFFHSHPDHPANASTTDLQEAYWFACSYLIVSVRNGRAGDSNSFVLCGTDDQDKRFDSEPVEIVEHRTAQP